MYMKEKQGPEQGWLWSHKHARENHHFHRTEPLLKLQSVFQRGFRETDWHLQGSIWAEAEERCPCAAVLFTVWPHKCQCTSLKLRHDASAKASQVLPLLPAGGVLHFSTTGFKFKWMHSIGENKPIWQVRLQIFQLVLWLSSRSPFLCGKEVFWQEHFSETITLSLHLVSAKTHLCSLVSLFSLF